MKRVFLTVLAAILLLSVPGCADKEPPAPPADTGHLTEEKLTGTYDVSYQTETESGSRTVDIVLLNDKLTFVLYPDRSLDRENSFDSYDPQTGVAKLQRTQQDAQGTLHISYALTFSEADGNITVSGTCTTTHGETGEKSCIISAVMIEKT